MLILCPSCRHAIRVRDLRPGRFTPRCPRCERSFQITVPEVKGQAPVVSVLDPSVFAEPVAIEPEPPVAIQVPPISWPADAAPPGLLSRWPSGLPSGTPRLLAAHLVLRLLGHGPRGRAFLAQPLGLGPPNVLKQVAADRVGDPVYLAHHVREAFAAAQVRHPDLARIRGLDRSRGHHVSVVERVAGPSLADLVRARAPMDPYQATLLILQAARGMTAAHAQGLRHKDLKPENIRLDPAGLAKVDDLGLEMTPSLAAAIEARDTPAGARRGKDSTPPAALVGTPACMAPEQARDPLTVDGRADIYALGATYYTMIAGRPPFEGDNAVELIRRHQEEDPIPPAEFAKELPRPIGDAIRTMMGKRPEERYPTMGVVVEVLERIMDLRGESVATLLGEAEERLRATAEVLSSSPARQVRVRIVQLCGAIGLTCCLLLLFLGLYWPAAGIVALIGLVSAAVTISSALLHQSPLPRLALGALLGTARGWVVAAALFVGALTALLLWGGFSAWFLIVFAVGLAAAYHFTLDRPWAAIRRPALAAARDCVRQLRLRGLDEATIAGLLVRAEGGRAGELSEATLGPDHPLIGPSAGGSWWRHLEQHRQDLLDRRHQALIELVEAGRLEASGLNLLTARRRARRIAKAIMVTTREWRDEQRLLAGGSTQPAGPPLLDRLSRSARQPEPVLEPHEPHRSGLLRRLDALAGLALGRKLRALIAIALLGMLAAWLDQKGILTFAAIRTQAAEAGHIISRVARHSDPAIFRELRWTLRPEWPRLHEPLDQPIVVDLIGPALPALNLAAAGLVLLISLLTSRRIAGLFSLLGAIVILFGPRWGLTVPALLPRLDAPAQAIAAGMVLFAVGLVWPRRRPEPA